MKILIIIFSLILLPYLTFTRNTVYKNDVSFWDDVVRKSGNPRGWINLSISYWQTGDLRKSEEAVERALTVYPEPLGYAHLGRIREGFGRPQEAQLLYEEAIKRAEADSVTEEMRKTAETVAYLGLGNIVLLKGEYGKAEVHYRHALELDPLNSHAWNNLGYSLLKQGKCDEAVPTLRRALELYPGDGLARENLEHAAKCINGKTNMPRKN